MPTNGRVTREWSEDMGEISGFGGGYERGCRAMVMAGMAWLDEHPDADPHFSGFKNVYGLITEANTDAKALTEAIMNARVRLDDGRDIRAGDDATGAMHHAAISHCFAYKRLGWEEYRRQLQERDGGAES